MVLTVKLIAVLARCNGLVGCAARLETELRHPSRQRPQLSDWTTEMRPAGMVPAGVAVAAAIAVAMAVGDRLRCVQCRATKLLDDGLLAPLAPPAMLQLLLLLLLLLLLPPPPLHRLLLVPRQKRAAVQGAVLVLLCLL